ncbi:MAG: VOC family protein [Pseudomonadota bacterium]
MLTSTNAIFCCLDMDRTVAFYESLGFKLHARYETYLVFARDNIELHFAHNSDHVPEKSQFAAYFHTDDVDALSADYEELPWQAEGFPRFGAAEDRAWGMRELHILDPDGNLLRMGMPSNG